MTSRGVAISIFSGAGGLDLGVERAGYEVRAAVGTWTGVAPLPGPSRAHAPDRY